MAVNLISNRSRSYFLLFFLWSTIIVLSSFIFFLNTAFSQETTFSDFYPHRIILGEGRVYVTTFQPSSSLYAFNKESGEVIWQSQKGVFENERFFKRGVFNQSSQEVYLPGQATGQLFIIQDKGDNMAITAKIPLSFGIKHIDFNKQINRIYVANNNELFIVDAISKKIISSTKFKDVIIADLSLNKEDNQVYLIDDNNSKLFVVDGINGKIINEFAVNRAPRSVYYNSLLKKIYVISNVTHSVSIINVGDWGVKTIPIGSGPLFISSDEQNGLVYISNNKSHNISVIDAKDAVSTIELPFNVQPGAIAVDSKGKKIYIEDITDKKIFVLNEKGETQTDVEIKRVADSFIFDNETNQLYVPLSALKSLFVIKGDKTVNIIGDKSFFNAANPLFLDGPFRVAVDDQSDTLYITTGRKGAIISYSAKDLNFKNKLEIDSYILNSLLVKDGRIAFVTANDEFILSDGSQILKRLKVGKLPRYMVEIDGFMYVANQKDKFISVINLKNGVVEASIPLQEAGTLIEGNQNRKEVYVISPANNSINVIDTQDKKIAGTVKFEGGNVLIFAFDYVSNDKFLYVLQDSNNLAVVDLSKKEIIDNISFDRPITGMSHLIFQGKTYLFNRSGGEIIALDTKSGEKEIFSVPWNPTNILPKKDPPRLYIIGGDDFGFGAINPVNDQIFFTKVGSGPTMANYDKSNNRTLVVNFRSNTVNIFEGDNYLYLASILFDGSVSWAAGKTPAKEASKYAGKLAGTILAGLVLMGLGFFVWRRFKIKKEAV